MKNLKIHLVFGLFIISLFLPQASFAYETTKQSALRINDNTVLYTITYRFGFLNREVYMPIGAVRGLANASTSPYLGYDILDNGKATSTGKTSALVLSKASIKNNQYFLPEGKVADFTLVTIVTLPKEMSEEGKNMALKVNHLPFIMVKDKSAGRTYLNERELEPYISPEAK